ncbi:hypothetical protein RB653_003797 [Dictyostelium firmibasis]|uniref:Dilute domain-containing protein n=1 Tax=Dictyostelium firmibasis TaxID=79012 RepID=A0AAN7YRV7_9MYCE
MMKHKGKDVLKVKVEILVKKVSNLKELNGGSVFVYWRRGTSKQSGETHHMIVRNGEAIFEEKISFESKFFIDAKSQKPDEKKLSLQLKEEKKKSQGKVLGKIELDLTSYMNSKHSQPIALSFTKGLKPEPQIFCSFNTIPLKHNNKPLIKVGGKDASKDPRIVRTFGGEDYFLDKTDDELSDTTVDTSMANDITSNDYSDEDINDDLGESKKDLKNEIDRLYKEIEGIESESYERLQTIKEREKDIDSLRKQIKILSDDVAEKDSIIENHQLEKDSLIDQQINEVARYSNDPTSEVEILRQEKMEKIAIITAQEKEISKLKKQIKQTALSNTEFSSTSGADLRTKYQALQQENEQQEKLIAQLEKEKQDLLDKQHQQQQLYSTTSASSLSNMGGGGNAGSLTNGKKIQSPEIVQTKASNTSGSIEELRKQSAAYKQELDEKALVERSIFLGEPQFRGNLPVSGINLFDGLVALGVLKDYKIGVRVFSSINIAFEHTFKKSSTDSSLLAYWLSASCLLLAKIKNKMESDQPLGGGGNTSPQYDQNGQLSPISSFEYNLKTIIFKFYSKLVQNAYNKLSPVLVKSILQHDILAFNSGKISRRKSTPDVNNANFNSNNNSINNNSDGASGVGVGVGGVITTSGSIPSSPQLYSHNNINNNNNNNNSNNNNNNHNHNKHGNNNNFNSNLTSNTTLDILQEFFEILRQNYVHPSLIGQFYSQLFYYINAWLLNSLNNIKGLCSVVNGFQMKIELSKIQDWVSISHLDESINQLEPMIETANLLVMDKELLSDEEVLHQVCPSVSMYQIKHLLQSFQTDQINSEDIPDSVFHSIDRLIHIRNEPLHADINLDITFMHQLSLDFLTKDPQYGRERKDNSTTTFNTNSYNTGSSTFKRF